MKPIMCQKNAIVRNGVGKDLSVRNASISVPRIEGRHNIMSKPSKLCDHLVWKVFIRIKARHQADS
jgi:hypothetical protein